MMQHYKTHMSIRTKRRKSPVVTDITYLKPKLYAHHEIDSNSLDRPLTIDQHLHVYRLNKQSQNHPLKYNMPEPLSSVAAERVSRRMSIKPDEQPSTGSHQQKENLSRLAFYEHTTLSYHKGLSKLPYPFTLPHPDKKQDVQQQKDHYVSPVLSKRVRNESSPKEHHSEQTQVIPSTFSGSHLAYIISTLD
ncbi:hypothetical protein RMCBS344292_16091 [Rhizopus microsporus]|nr:hypothetical protein RMCBS344292_16091 [Rhizopus microsporus]